MKKVLNILLLLVILVGLSGCKQEEINKDYIVLPDLSGKTNSEIVDMFDNYNQSYKIEIYDQEVELYSDQFIMYVNYDTGDIVATDEEVIISVYPFYTGLRTFVILPDLEGFSRTEIDAYFDDFGINVSFSETLETTEANQNMFKGYGSFYVIGDQFSITGTLSVIVYPEFDDPTAYFNTIEMVYDGPRLDSSFEEINPVDPRGGSFDVTLQYCGDGDTARFDYPTEVYDAIFSSAKSTRFLNMDTEETFSGGEEEWGKPGSVYTCELLEAATAIKLQTDPGDALTGTYGRLLAWIWIKLPGEVEFQLLNYMVVKQGLAQVKYEFGAGDTMSYGDHTYNEWMHIAEEYAIDNELGQWGNKLDYYWNYQSDEPDYFKWH